MTQNDDRGSRAITKDFLMLRHIEPDRTFRHPVTGVTCDYVGKYIRALGYSCNSLDLISQSLRQRDLILCEQIVPAIPPHLSPLPLSHPPSSSSYDTLPVIPPWVTAAKDTCVGP